MFADVPSYHQVNSSPEVNNNEMYGFYNKPIPVGNTQIRKDNHIINGNNPEHVRIRKRGRPRTKEVQSVKKGIMFTFVVVKNHCYSSLHCRATHWKTLGVFEESPYG